MNFVTRYSEFVRLVKRRNSRSLIPALASLSSKQALTVYRPDSSALMPPWAVAAIARESVAWADDRKNRLADKRSLQELWDYYAALRDPFLDDHDSEDALTSFMIRTVFEQFPHQHSLFEDIARVLPLLDPCDGDGPKKSLEVISSSAWAECLGTSLENFVRTGTLFATGAWVNNGTFVPDWLDKPTFAAVTERVPVEEVKSLFDRYFSVDWDRARVLAREGRPVHDDLRRFDYNFLTSSPFVETSPGVFHSPQAAFVARRVSPASLYYIAMERWGVASARDFGHLLEAYTGRQLRLLESLGVIVVPEIEYKPASWSCDYLIDTGPVVVAVEVKSARVAMPGRLDIEGYSGDVEKDVGKAFDQLTTTSGLLRAEHEKFPSHLQSKPIRGIVVTGEYHYLANSAPIRARLQDPNCPTAVLSIGELERLIEHGLGEGRADVLVRLTNADHSGVINASEEFKKIETEYHRARNPILDDGWKRAEWRFPGYEGSEL